ncbi:hypothetical protein BpHYR1_011712 [Brachionus plicatilis]|uniref:Uncharacterized protein n=1 Tax=Brachionus plicatilis TaxID=10195 RepID=A0A3M7Q8E9_BRAPC|nr:hypothetical protein BpHYR1_011712 [Brachionus plicatilis]
MFTQFLDHYSKKKRFCTMDFSEKLKILLYLIFNYFKNKPVSRKILLPYNTTLVEKKKKHQVLHVQFKRKKKNNINNKDNSNSPIESYNNKVKESFTNGTKFNLFPVFEFSFKMDIHLNVRPKKALKDEEEEYKESALPQVQINPHLIKINVLLNILLQKYSIYVLPYLYVFSTFFVCFSPPPRKNVLIGYKIDQPLTTQEYVCIDVMNSKEIIQRRRLNHIDICFYCLE